MGFADTLNEWPEDRVRALMASRSEADVRRALDSQRRGPNDLAALLSDAATPLLESIAAEAQRLTRLQFGRTIGMYAPIYISNVCAADCSYCSYAARSGARQKRRTLSDDQIRAECDALHARGFRSVLLLTGEAPAVVDAEAIGRAVDIARTVFPSVCVEVYALSEDAYRMLVGRGLEGVTLYQETYHRPTYSQVHLHGGKTDFDSRLDAIERAGRAGARRLSVGSLLGLYDWRVDGFWCAMHVRYLETKCWQSAVSVSFPRLRHVPDRFEILHAVSDRQLVQLIVAMRLFAPEAGFNLSTREPSALRDRLIPLGMTMMSAGSSTRPGGYTTAGDETLAQFDIEDRRSPADVAQAIRRAGYDPVWKDFDSAFHIGADAST